MPELPDIELYLHALRPRVVGRSVTAVRLRSPFFLRTFEPDIDAVRHLRVQAVSRIGKRIVMSLESDLHLVIHLMIAGRFRWLPPGAKPPGKICLCEIGFDVGKLIVTEAGTKKRASLHVVGGADGLEAFRRGGLDLLSCDAKAFARRFTAHRHTLKRALTDPRIIDGVGNAYSDEILHAACLSPFALTSSLDGAAANRLGRTARQVMQHWIDKLREEFGDRFPGAGDVTAFRPDFAVHGRYGKPCPACGTTVQRIIYADRETNYCPRCQTKGKMLADRSLSRLLKDDWPKSIEELEDR